MDSIKAYEDLKAKAEAARLKAIEELEQKKTALLGQVKEIDDQLVKLGVEPTKQPGREKGTGKGAMTEEKRKKLSEAASKRWEEKKKQAQ